jgi:hypothetical protein
MDYSYSGFFLFCYIPMRNTDRMGEIISVVPRGTPPYFRKDTSMIIPIITSAAKLMIRGRMTL